MNHVQDKPTPANRYLQLPLPRKTIFVNNFIGGIAWGLGATVGLSIVLAIFGILLHFVNVVPVIGNFVAAIVQFVEQQHTHL